jgi:hypothetical protein
MELPTIVSRVSSSLLQFESSCRGLSKMADSWRYKLLGVENGPVSFEALFQLAHSSVIGPDDEVREGEAGEWMPAGSIVGLFSTPQATTGDSNAAVADSSATGSSSRPLAPISKPSADGSVLFYWQSFGQEFGPVPLDDFTEMIQREQLSAGDQLRIEAADGWLPLRMLNDLSAAFPSAAASATSNSASATDDGVLFYWQSFGQEFGPVPLDDFKEMIQREQLSADDLVRVEAADGWLPVGILCDLSVACRPTAELTDVPDNSALLPGFDQLESVEPSADPFAEMAAQAGLASVDP